LNQYSNMILELKNE